jgi:hypothetical protein
MDGSNTQQSGVIESRSDFTSSPRGQFQFWDEELKASQKSRKSWHKQADAINKRFLDSRRKSPESAAAGGAPFRLNLFHSNITTLMSMLYGNLPKVDVARRYADPDDDVGRVASEIMARLLNNDIAENGEEYNAVLRSTLQDRLLGGLGCARVRYEVETEMQGEEEVVSYEAAPIEYFFWRDILWGWGRSWSEIPWLAYRSYLTKDEVAERWGDKKANELQYQRQLVDGKDDNSDQSSMSSPWQKAEIWEIWDKVEKKIVFIGKGCQAVLETKNDELGLNGFYPSPPFFIANATTTLYTPTPDYHLVQDLYNEVDKLQTRISIITDAVKVVGLYDSGSAEIVRMFQEGVDNKLIPVDNWAMFGEKGGIQGSVSWLPIMDIVNALDKLRDLRDESIALLNQVTGMSEVMRGGSQGQYEGVGQAQLQAKFGSVRVQALQDEFATFATNAMQLKAEIICKHFSPENIIKQANIEKTADRERAPDAVMLLKNFEQARLQVDIRPESVAMVDYAQLKSERTDYINALAVFLQSAAPLMETEPASKPFLMQLLQWGLAGFKGANEIEGVIDNAIDAVKKAEQEKSQKPPEPDPEQQKAEMAMKLEQAKQQGELSKIQAKAQADLAIRESDKQADIATALAQHQSKLAEIEAELQATTTEIQSKMQADIMVERVQAESNAMQSRHAAEAEMEKDAVETELGLGAEEVKTGLQIQANAAQAANKIRETEAKPKGGSENADE